MENAVYKAMPVLYNDIMNTDGYFTIGTTHKVCEDYVLNGQEPFIVVCDGCSTAAQSDIGARLMALAARPYLSRPFGESLVYGILTEAYTYCRTLGIDPSVLCSTLLMARVEPEYREGSSEPYDVVKVIMAGDGAIAYKPKDGWLKLINYEFISGAPYYLRYELDAELKAKYWKDFGAKVVRHEYEFLPSGQVLHSENTFDLLPSGKKFFEHEWLVEDVEFVALMSDGVSHFIKMDKKGTSLSPVEIPIEAIVPELLAFKNHTGEFVQRRCKKAFEKFESLEYQHTDDVSVAVLYVKE